MELSKYKSDLWAIIVSVLCLVHCLLTPVLISSLPFLIHSEYDLHVLISLFLVILGGYAVTKGYRLHRQISVLLLAVLGFSLIIIGAAFENEINHPFLITAIGSIVLITNHLMNIRFCRCQCCKNQSHG